MGKEGGGIGRLLPEGAAGFAHTLTHMRTHVMMVVTVLVKSGIVQSKRRNMTEAPILPLSLGHPKSWFAYCLKGTRGRGSG